MGPSAASEVYKSRGVSGRAVRTARPDTLLLVDGISGLGTAPFLTDAWDVDVVVTGSQKAWMDPPGMTMLSVSARAWAATATARLPRYYWDFAKARKAVDEGPPPYTPAASLYYALQAGLRLLRVEGREAMWTSLAAIARRTREGVQRRGLRPFADPAHYSPSVTSSVVPDGVDGKHLVPGARRGPEDAGAGRAPLFASKRPAPPRRRGAGSAAEARRTSNPPGVTISMRTTSPLASVRPGSPAWTV